MELNATIIIWFSEMFYKLLTSVNQSYDFMNSSGFNLKKWTLDCILDNQKYIYSVIHTVYTAYIIHTGGGIVESRIL